MLSALTLSCFTQVHPCRSASLLGSCASHYSILLMFEQTNSPVCILTQFLSPETVKPSNTNSEASLMVGLTAFNAVKQAMIYRHLSFSAAVAAAETLFVMSRAGT